jgi:hypothetical protein
MGKIKKVINVVEWGHLAVVALLLIVSAIAGTLSFSSPTFATVGDIVEYPIPTNGTDPNYLTNGPDGKIWYSGYSKPIVGAVSITGVSQEHAGEANNYRARWKSMVWRRWKSGGYCKNDNRWYCYLLQSWPEQLCNRLN